MRYMPWSFCGEWNCLSDWMCTLLPHPLHGPLDHHELDEERLPMPLMQEAISGDAIGPRKSRTKTRGDKIPASYFGSWQNPNQWWKHFSGENNSEVGVKSTFEIRGWGFVHWVFVHWGFVHWVFVHLGFVHWVFMHWGFVHWGFVH